MEYEIIKKSGINDIKISNPEVLYIEEEKTGDYDNSFVILQTEKFTIGFSYYDMGLKPEAYFTEDLVFLGFGRSIIIYNFNQKKIVFEDTNSARVFYTVLFEKKSEHILFIFETALLCFDKAGKITCVNDYPKIICDWKLEEGRLEIRFFDDDSKIIYETFEW